MDALYLSFFGGFSVARAGVPLAGFASDKARLLLAYLAVEDWNPHRRESLCGLFWPEKPDRKARHSLRQALSSLKKTLHGDGNCVLLDITPQTIYLHTEKIGMDVRQFEAAIQAATHHAHQPPWVCLACLEQLEQAIDLYHGDFLAGLSPTGSPALEDWLLLQQEKYREKMIRATAQVSAWLEALGKLDQALTTARRHLSLDPLDEAAHRQVMRLLAQQGRRLEALAHYEACQRLLANELDVPPQPETLALYEKIQRQTEGLASPPAGLGNLPTSLTPLIGRNTELEQLRHRLIDPSCRLLTVTGLGGTGKTCLALEAGRSLQAYFPEGIILVELDTQPSSLTLLPAIARAVGLEMNPETDLPSRAPAGTLLEQICRFLRDQRSLLILDSFEGMLAEAELVATLLRWLPLLKVLVTSRLRLNLTMEQVFLVEGLEYPAEAAVETLSAYPAVQLFVEGTRRLQPAFELDEHNQLAVGEICRLTQGVPLGILLATAWSHIFPPEHIAAEIRRSLDFLAADWRDLPDRQRSLRATFDYSWRLLPPAKKPVFLRLAVLRGAFILERAAQVAGATAEDLKQMVDQSLLQSLGGGLFRLHDLLRQYALEALAADPASSREAHQRHSQVYLEALAAWEPGLKSSQQYAVLAQIDLELADILAAWRWAVAHQPPALLTAAVEALGYYLFLSSLPDEGVALCQQSIQHLEAEGIDAANLRLRARLGTWLAIYLHQQNQSQQALEAITRTKTILEEANEALVGDMRREGAMLQLTLGEILLYGSHTPLQSLPHLERGLALMYALEEPWDISYALVKMVSGLDYFGLDLQANRFHEQALSIQRSLRDPYMLGACLYLLSSYYLKVGDYESAQPLVDERIASLPHHPSHFTLAKINEHRALLLFYQGQYQSARLLFEQGQSRGTRPEEKIHNSFNRFFLTCIDLLTGNYTAVLEKARQLDTDPDGEDARYFDLFTASAYLATGEWDRGEKTLRKYLEFLQALPHYSLQGQTLATLGYIEYRRGNLEAALDDVAQALVNGLEYRYYWAFLAGLSVLALILAEAGLLEQAVRLYATVLTHPSAANSRWFEDMFGKPIAALAANLTTEQVAAAQAAGRGASLDAAAREALDQLRASPGLGELLANRLQKPAGSPPEAVR